MQGSGRDEIRRTPQTVYACDVEPRQVEWLWPEFIPLGKLTIIAGDGGLGKSMLTLDLAARTTTGEDWPDGSPNLLGEAGVLVINAEDDAGDTLIPRLNAAGARYRNSSGRECLAFCTDYGEDAGDGPRDRSIELGDVDVIAQAALDVDAKLIIIDPASAFMGGGGDDHKDSDVRGVLRPLAHLAERERLAIVIVKHLNKQQSKSASHRVGGSVAWTTAARCARIVLRDPEDHDTRVFAPIKNNLGDDRTSVRYTIEENEHGPRIVWGDSFQAHANDILEMNGDRVDPMLVEDAEEFLRSMLSDGEVPAAEIIKAAKQNEHDKDALMSARNKLGVQARTINARDRAFTVWTLGDSGSM